MRKGRGMLRREPNTLIKDQSKTIKHINKTMGKLVRELQVARGVIHELNRQLDDAEEILRGFSGLDQVNAYFERWDEGIDG